MKDSKSKSRQNDQLPGQKKQRQKNQTSRQSNRTSKRKDQELRQESQGLRQKDQALRLNDQITPLNDNNTDKARPVTITALDVEYKAAGAHLTALGKNLKGCPDHVKAGQAISGPPNPPPNPYHAALDRAAPDYMKSDQAISDQAQGSKIAASRQVQDSKISPSGQAHGLQMPISSQAQDSKMATSGQAKDMQMPTCQAHGSKRATSGQAQDSKISPCQAQGSQMLASCQAQGSQVENPQMQIRNPQVWNIPLPNPSFTGRMEILKELRAAFTSTTSSTSTTSTTSNTSTTSTTSTNQETASIVQAQVICGPAGIGKSQIAIEYAHRHKNDYKAVIWVKSSTREAVIRDFAAIAALLNLPQKAAQDQSLIVAAVKQWLEENTDWLLIFDSAGQPELIKDFLPESPKGHILLTSQAKNFDILSDVPGVIPAIAKPIEVKAMLPDEALQFLYTRTGRRSDDDAGIASSDILVRESSFPPTGSHLHIGAGYYPAKTFPDSRNPDSRNDVAEKNAAIELIHELGCLPLALELAGAYIAAQNTGFRDYLASFRKHILKLPGKMWAGAVETTTAGEKVITTTASEARASDYPASVAVTWAISFQEIESISEAAAELLRFSAFLAPDSIPVELLLRGASQLGPALSAALVYAGKDRLSLTVPQTSTNREMELLSLLARYSFISMNPDSDNYSIRPFMQAILKNSMDKVNYRLWSERAIRALDQAFPDIEFSYWRLCDRLLPHALSIAKNMGNLRFAFQEAARLLNQAGYYLYVRAQYAEAEPLYKQALAIWERMLGLDHHRYTTKGIGSHNKLSVHCGGQAKYGEADPLYRRTLATIRGKTIDPDQPSIVYPFTAQLPAAHLPTAHLPTAYQPTAYQPTAYQPIDNQSTIHQSTAHQPASYPSMAASFNNLEALSNFGALYDIQGTCVLEVEPLCKPAPAPAVWEKVLSHDNLYVAQNLSNLAALYDDYAQYAEAEPLYRRALSIREDVLGSGHPDVARNLDNLAILYYVQGDYVEAERLYRRALAAWENALGPEHPDVAKSINNLANACSSQGKYDEAAQLHKRALAIRKKALGPDHPDVAISLNNLVAIYNAQGKYIAAEPLYKRAIAIREKSLGPDHPIVAQNLSNLAEFHRSQGKYAEAEPLIRRALSIRKKTLGPDHPDVAASLNSLAMLYHFQTKHTEAEQLYKQALTIWEKALDPDHPTLAQALNNLTALYYGQARYEEAEPLYRQSLAIWEKTLGPDHPDMAIYLENYANLLHKTNKEDDAVALEARARAIRDAKCDKGHLRVV